MSITLITGEQPEFFIAVTSLKSRYSLAFDFVSALFILINVDGRENNLMRAA